MDTTILGEWTFDDGMGGPDPQGWTTVDLTEQIGVFFHVDDFAGLGGGNFTPMQGTKSLWCGARAGAMPELCGYATLPGYGNHWRQGFESTALPTTGDVTMRYWLRYDTDPSYDFVRVEYQSKSGRWNELRAYTGAATVYDSVIVDADSLAGSVKLRFKFESDDGWSDQDGLWPTDGALMVDMLAVTDNGALIDYQDFEAEAVGMTATVDGHWTATTVPTFGDYAALVDGATVLQEDPLVTNSTHQWGFFSGSPSTYVCGGHPEQAAVPFSRTTQQVPVYINNEIRSPAIPLTGYTPTSQLLLEFDVYRDLPLDNLVFYKWHVRSRVNGCWQPWRDRD
ncbi:MAG: hypothetical protein OEX18_14030, partial [Candidatus Krumholzibacteria bacterium]|nr:hypothetical protein [Candidatus Krumholzibacteria bacterium]